MRFKHLTDINETYTQHFKVAFVAGLKMMTAGFCLIMHALIPSICLTTGSDMVKSMAAFFKKRAEACQSQTVNS